MFIWWQFKWDSLCTFQRLYDTKLTSIDSFKVLNNFEHFLLCYNFIIHSQRKLTSKNGQNILYWKSRTNWTQQVKLLKFVLIQKRKSFNLSESLKCHNQLDNNSLYPCTIQVVIHVLICKELSSTMFSNSVRKLFFTVYQIICFSWPFDMIFERFKVIFEIKEVI